MKVIILGGAGAMGSIVARDLVETSQFEEICITDYNEKKASELAQSFKDKRVTVDFLDAYNVEKVSQRIKDYNVLVNAARYDTCIPVMKACLKARVRHYNDLGGHYRVTKKQLELHDEFKKAGITAVIGVGMSVGTTNVMARYAYDLLDEIESVQFQAGGRDMTDYKGVQVCLPPSSQRTLMREFIWEPEEFIDGKYQTFPVLSGAEEITFPEPIGTISCTRVVHAELATIPKSFADKGIKNVTWRYNLIPRLNYISQILAMCGMGSEEEIDINGKKVLPIDVLMATMQREAEVRTKGLNIKTNTIMCQRVIVDGKKNGKNVQHILWAMYRPYKPWDDMDWTGTGMPPSIVAQMQGKGDINIPGVLPPEIAIDPIPYFKELAKRDIFINHEIKQQIV